MLNPANTVIVCIDLQEKLVKMLNNPDVIASNCTKLMQTANILNIETIITEQYPKGLGETIESINSIKTFKKIEKTTFSAYETDEFKKYIDSLNKKQVIIFGIETHICTLQTTIDLINKGYEVYVVQDCSSSRNESNHNCALDLIKQKGGFITSLEIVLFDFLKSSKHPNFKEIQSLIK
ncbi:MAG: hydrolase [Candidatus Gastranaerophilales bacterium]|nr:hydrolase [Candidatus Gastranaerophilales bacterium]